METKCSTCLGCNRLEDRNFKEITECMNYARATPTAKDNISRIKNILEIQERIEWK